MYASASQLIILIVVLGSLVILFIGSCIILVVLKYQKDYSTHANALSLLNSNHENAILQAKIEMQEQTFINISRDIHDNIGQKLSIAKLGLISLKSSHIVVHDSIKFISEAVSDLRDLSRNLSADEVISDGLIQSLNREISQLKKLGLYEIEFEQLGETIFLNSQKELVIFRIVQEGLQNIFKHACANRISIITEYTELFLFVWISDNGIGFQRDHQEGQGIRNMKARATLIKGFFSLHSDSTGTTIEIKIPI